MWYILSILLVRSVLHWGVVSDNSSLEPNWHATPQDLGFIIQDNRADKDKEYPKLQTFRHQPAPNSNVRAETSPSPKLFISPNPTPHPSTHIQNQVEDTQINDQEPSTTQNNSGQNSVHDPVQDVTDKSPELPNCTEDCTASCDEVIATEAPTPTHHPTPSLTPTTQPRQTPTLVGVPTVVLQPSPTTSPCRPFPITHEGVDKIECLY